MASLKKFRHTGKSFADLLPYAALVDNGIMLLKDGALMAGWYFAGPDSESSTGHERNDVSRIVNSVLSKLGTGWMIQFEAVRVPTTSYPELSDCHFPDRITKIIDAERRQHFESKDIHFESKHALVMTYREPEPNKSKLVKYLYADNDSRASGFADRALANFKSAIREFEQYLSSTISIQRMRTHEIPSKDGSRIEVYDDLSQFTRFCLIGENHPVQVPGVGMYMDYVISAEFHHGLTPLIDNRYLKIVAIDGFPAASAPGMLNNLDQLPFTYRWSSRFMFLDVLQAKSKLEKARKSWLQKVRPLTDQLFQTNSGSADQDAMSMVEEAEDAIGVANSGTVAFGYYTPVIVLMDTNETRLNENAETVRRLVQQEGFGARVETLNTTDAFIGSLPGVSYANLRQPLVTTRNLADLAPLNSVWTGSETAPCDMYPHNSPPLMQVASGSTPFRLNLHSGDLGHTLILGPTGSGKSTLLSLITAQFPRYENAQTFVFDKGNSMYPLTLAAGGSHYDVGKGEALAFCPLSFLETASDRAWAASWIETLVSLQGATTTPEMRNAITKQIELMVTSKSRSLSDFVSGVQFTEVKSALKYYTIEGALGHLLDAESDNLSLSNFQTFEIEELMNLGDRSLIPVLLYLFRRIESNLNGQPSIIVLDEAWLMLGHDVFKEKIREWLKVLRKRNCAVVMATQSISDAVGSGIFDVLVESCPTKICLPNGAANLDGTRDFYRQLGFNDRQIEIVANSIPKRDYYVVSPEGRRLFHMALGPITLSFVGASGKEDLKRISTLHETYGEEWPVHWLKERGITDAESLLL